MIVNFLCDSTKLQLVSIALALLSIFVAIIVYWLQNKEKKIFAINALQEEIKNNIGLIRAYIEHSTVGANLTEGTYELNVPERAAYDQYLGFICKNDLVLAGQIRKVYLDFSACKSIIEMIHNFIANSLFIALDENKGTLLSKGIVVLNRSLKRLSDEINSENRIDSLITRLEQLK